MTVDEELSLLEDHLRRLKIEYDVYFNGGSPRTPNDLEWKVQAALKKYSDGGPKMSFGQRFRYNAIAQKYAVFSDLWRQKRQIKEEGYRRPQDAILGITGLRSSDGAPEKSKSQVIARMLADSEPVGEAVRHLYEKMMDARKQSGLGSSGSFEGFLAFVSLKTAQIRSQYGCKSVEYTVEVDGDKVLLKAKAQN